MSVVSVLGVWVGARIDGCGLRSGFGATSSDVPSDLFSGDSNPRNGKWERWCGYGAVGVVGGAIGVVWWDLVVFAWVCGVKRCLEV